MFKLVALMVVMAVAAQAKPFDLPTNGEFNFDITPEDMQKFESLLGEFKQHMWDNREIFRVVRAAFNDEAVAEELKSGVKNVMESTDKKQAIYDFFHTFVMRLDEVAQEDSEFEMTEEENAHFEDLIHFIGEELFEKKRIFAVVKALVKDSQVRDMTLDHLKEVVHGDSPLKALFTFLETFKAELEKIESTEYDMNNEETKHFDGLLGDLADELFEQRKIYGAIQALLGNGPLRDEAVDALDKIVSSDKPKEAVTAFLEGFLAKLQEN